MIIFVIYFPVFRLSIVKYFVLSQTAETSEIKYFYWQLNKVKVRESTCIQHGLIHKKSIPINIKLSICSLNKCLPKYGG